MSGTSVAVIPANIQLPAHLQTAEAVAAIAAYNAAAAGGIKAGGFPRISIKGGKFHIVKGGETVTLMMPAQPGQPALPRMVLEVVVVAANPDLSKKFYEGEYQPGDDKEPTCSSENGQVPDSHIAAPQSPNCATCPQNQWGSKVSKITGKDIKACSDEKRLAILPGQDLAYEALGFAITPTSLGDWGKYVKALSERNIAVNAVVTNVTFDTTAAYPKTLFSFNRFLTAEEYAKVQERASGEDVKNIVAPARQIVPQLAAPATPAPAAPPAPPAPIQPQPVAPAAPAPVMTDGFGGSVTVAPAAPPAPAAPVAPVAPPAEPKKPRKPRTPAVSADDPLAHLPAQIRATVELLGVEDPTAQALLAKYPKPPAQEQATPAPAAPAVTAPAGGGFGAGPAASAATVTSAPAAAAATGNPLDLKNQLAARLMKGQGAAAAPQ